MCREQYEDKEKTIPAQYSSLSSQFISISIGGIFFSILGSIEKEVEDVDPNPNEVGKFKALMLGGNVIRCGGGGDTSNPPAPTTPHQLFAPTGRDLVPSSRGTFGGGTPSTTILSFGATVAVTTSSLVDEMVDDIVVEARDAAVSGGKPPANRVARSADCSRMESRPLFNPNVSISSLFTSLLFSSL